MMSSRNTTEFFLVDPPLDTLSSHLSEAMPSFFHLSSEINPETQLTAGIFARAPHQGLGGQISAKLICDEGFKLMGERLKDGLFGFELLREVIKGVNVRVVELGYKLTAKGKMQGEIVLFILTPDGTGNGLLLEAAKVGGCGGIVIRKKRAMSLFSSEAARSGQDYVRLGWGGSVPTQMVSVVLSRGDVCVFGGRISPAADSWILEEALRFKRNADGDIMVIRA